MASILAKQLKGKSNSGTTPSLFVSLYSQAISASAALEFERALGLYDQAIAISPSHAEAYYKRGNALKDLGRFYEVITSPWYPSVKLYRQKLSGGWREVFERVAADLRREFKIS
jgi:tetratricopeptide (TPR) repeat protein